MNKTQNKDANKSAAKYCWVFGIIDLKTNANKNRSESNMIKDRLGGRRFH